MSCREDCAHCRLFKQKHREKNLAEDDLLLARDSGDTDAFAEALDELARIKGEKKAARVKRDAFCPNKR